MTKKKKKSKDPFTNFVNRIFTRKKAKREYVIPIAYITAVATQLHKTNPSLVIIKNTLTEFWEVAYEKGYIRKGEDSAWFKTRQEKHLKEEFDQFITYLDDLTKDKSGISFSFKEWEERQKNLSKV